MADLLYLFIEFDRQSAVIVTVKIFNETVSKWLDSMCVTLWPKIIDTLFIITHYKWEDKLRMYICKY